MQTHLLGNDTQRLLLMLLLKLFNFHSSLGSSTTKGWFQPKYFARKIRKYFLGTTLCLVRDSLSTDIITIAMKNVFLVWRQNPVIRMLLTGKEYAFWLRAESQTIHLLACEMKRFASFYGVQRLGVVLTVSLSCVHWR